MDAAPRQMQPPKDARPDTRKGVRPRRDPEGSAYWLRIRLAMMPVVMATST